MAKRSGGLQKAARALATADGVAHAIFFSMFAWRIFASSPFGKPFAIVLALTAAAGFGASVVGWMLVKHGGRTPARNIGMWLISGSTAMAALLLLLA